MLAKDGRYFGRLLNGYQGVTQGHLLSSTIFNMVVGVVIRHWVRVVTPSEEITGGVALRDTLVPIEQASEVPAVLG